MKKLLVSITILVVALSSCGPDEPLEYKYMWEGKFTDFGGLAVCCQKPGNNCLNKTTTFFPPTFRSYALHDSLAWYFQTQNWQNDFPELISYPQIVDTIIRTNPKGLFVRNYAFVILRDRSNPDPVTDNVLFALRTAPDPCKDFFEQF
jgi:hypothetical protein